MSDPSDYPAITAKVGGRFRRLVTSRQWRSAIASGDIDRETEISYEPSAGTIAAIRAADCPALSDLFEELLAPPVDGQEMAVDARPQADASPGPAPPLRPDTTPAVPLPGTKGKTSQPGASAGRPASANPAVRQEGQGASLADAADPGDSVTDGGKAGVKLGALALLVLAGLGIMFLMFGASDPAPPEAIPIEADPGETIPQIPTEIEEIPQPEASESLPEPVASASPSARDQRNRTRREPPVQEAAPAATPSSRVPELVIKEQVFRAREAVPRNQDRWAQRIASNYPARAVRSEIEGRVQVRVIVGPDGRVQGCTVTGSSGSDILDDAACEGMGRYARFDPALDDRGNPTMGSHSTTIVYQLD